MPWPCWPPACSSTSSTAATCARWVQGWRCWGASVCSAGWNGSNAAGSPASTARTSAWMPLFATNNGKNRHGSWPRMRSGPDSARHGDYDTTTNLAIHQPASGVDGIIKGHFGDHAVEQLRGQILGQALPGIHPVRFRGHHTVYATQGDASQNERCYG